MKTILSASFILISALFSIQPAFADITISDAYVRAMPPGSPNTVAYMSIANNTDNDLRLLDVDSNIARSTEIHKAAEEQGIMKMLRAEEVNIPAKSTLELKPGGYHVMFIGLKKPTNEDDMVMLKLSFSDGSKQMLHLSVKKVMASMAEMNHHKMDHSKMWH